LWESGEDHDRNIRADAFHLKRKLCTVHPRHLVVNNRGVKALVFVQAQTLPRIDAGNHLETESLKQAAANGQALRVVVDTKESWFTDRHAGEPPSGN